MSRMTRSISELMKLTQGERLVRARKVAGLTQEHMAEVLGKDVRTIGRWERDQSPVGRDALIAWAAITEAPLSWLLGEEGGKADTDPVFLGEQDRSASLQVRGQLDLALAA